MVDVMNAKGHLFYRLINRLKISRRLVKKNLDLF